MMTSKKDDDEQFWREAPVLKLADGLYPFLNFENTQRSKRGKQLTVVECYNCLKAFLTSSRNDEILKSDKNDYFLHFSRAMVRKSGKSRQLLSKTSKC